LDGDLKKALKKLSEEEQQRFWQLADSHSPGCRFPGGSATEIWISKSKEIKRDDFGGFYRNV
jgi:hypothetical protein